MIYIMNQYFYMDCCGLNFYCTVSEIFMKQIFNCSYVKPSQPWQFICKPLMPSGKVSGCRWSPLILYKWASESCWCRQFSVKPFPPVQKSVHRSSSFLNTFNQQELSLGTPTVSPKIRQISKHLIVMQRKILIPLGQMRQHLYIRSKKGPHIKYIFKELGSLKLQYQVRLSL